MKSSSAASWHLGQPPADPALGSPGYAYFAMEQSSLSIVRGEEPEYEETTPLAPLVRRVAAAHQGSRAATVALDLTAATAAARA